MTKANHRDQSVSHLCGNKAKCYFILGKKEGQEGWEEAFTLLPTPRYFSSQM